MTKNSLLTKEDFDSLLYWFSPNRDEAGLKYEEIRNGLIRFFHYKGCSEAENLADETINRVAKKLSVLNTDNNYKHLTYFYGFASKIYLEYKNKVEKKEVEFENNVHLKEPLSEVSDNLLEGKHKCLESCISKLSAEDKHLIIQYFTKDKSEKFEHRRKLAESLNLSMGNLHVKVYRLKGVLKKCIEKCVDSSDL